MPAGEALSVEVAGVEKELLSINGLALTPPGLQPNQRRQERFSLLEMEFGQRVILQEMFVNFRTSEVSLFGRIHSALVLAPQTLVPRRSTLTSYYARKAKKKVLHTYFQGAGQPFINIDRALENYDCVYCVDTNTGVSRSGQKIAVTTALAVKTRPLGQAAVHFRSDFTIQLVARNPPPGNPEVHGIWSLLDVLAKEHPKMVEGRLAIITDTELGLVKSWQDRTEPFYGGHVLPQGVDIFYATSDAGGDEFMPNRLMRTCDSLSAKKLRDLLID